jgi:hypothetical protein
MVLVAFAKLRKATTGFVMSSVRPYGTTVLPVVGLFVKFHIVDSVKVCGENQVG